MKNYFFSILAISLFVVSALGQLQKTGSSAESYSPDELKIKERFDHTVGLVDVSGKGKELVTGVRTSTVTTTGAADFGPGDTPAFLLHVNATKGFVRRGEIVDFTLYPTSNSSQTYYVGGQIYKPGYDGYYDGSERIGYFGAPNAIRGTEVGESIEVYSRMFNQEDSNGWFQISVAVWDTNGVLVQQLWANLYLTTTGPYSSWYFIKEVKAADYSLQLQGQFPVGLPIFYMVGIPNYGFTITGPNPQYAVYSTQNGKRLVLPTRVQFNSKAAIDIMLWSPVTREATIAPKSLVEDAFQFPTTLK